MLLSLSSVSAKRVGVYCFFENTGQQLYEDDKVQVVTMCVDNEMKVAIQNKTSEIIYIDKANSFVYINGTPISLFSNSVTTTSTAESGGTAFNMGGAARALGLGGPLGALMGATTVSGGTTTSNTTVVYEQRVLAIAPNSAEIMYTCKVELKPAVIDKGSEWGLFKCGRNGKFIDSRTGRSEKFKIGMQRAYNQYETPFEVKFVTTYSTDENFSEKQLVSVDHYISDIVIDHRRMMKKKKLNVPYCEPYLATGREYYTFVTGSAPWLAIGSGVAVMVAIGGGAALALVAVVSL